MKIVARKVIKNGEEIIELDLNKPWSKTRKKYPSYMDEVDSLSFPERKRKSNQDFITVLN